ncbi:MAG: GFA family protein [Pseudoxanthomonas sp.]
MKYAGSCHCGRIAFEVEGEIDQVHDCNCSMCRRRGGLLWFVPRAALALSTPESDLSTYTFNKRHLQHRFCAHCGIATFSEGVNPKTGAAMAAVNVRCLPEVELSALKVVPVDGASF